MKAFYRKPISTDRFKEYLSKLEGDTEGDMVLPIAGFNPMAKDHVLAKIEDLERLNAELIMKEVILNLNLKLESVDHADIEVVLNLADDLKGAWTNHYSTDYESKFKTKGTLNRNFCTPYFWSSEVFTEEQVQQRTKEYLYRALYQLDNNAILSLEHHFNQELFVAKNCLINEEVLEPMNIEAIESFYSEHKYSESYDLIFNFFYGDKGSESLGYKTYGIETITGFEFAKQLTQAHS